MSENTTPDIFSLSEIPVVLTYSGFGIPPITFYMRPFMNREESDLRQALFALTDAEREKAQHAHNVDLLCRLTTRAPEGLPGFKDTGTNVAASLRELLSGSEPMKIKLAADALTRYYRVTQPAEFFRDV